MTIMRCFPAHQPDLGRFVVDQIRTRTIAVTQIADMRQPSYEVQQPLMQLFWLSSECAWCASQCPASILNTLEMLHI